jgi:hypothetical protein
LTKNRLFLCKARRAEGDDVAIIRNGNGVELNLIFNANAGEPGPNVLMDVPEKYPGFESRSTKAHCGAFPQSSCPSG